MRDTITKDIAGFQVEIEFDNSKLVLLDKQVTAGGDLVESTAGGTVSGADQWSNDVEKGSITKVRLSYVFDGVNADYSQKFDPGANMMELVFKTKEAGVDLSSAITLGTNIPFEVYEADGCLIRQDFVAEIKQIEETKSFMGFKEKSEYQTFSMSVSPNPVANSNRAAFIIKSPVDEKYEVVFYSMTTGEKVHSFSAITLDGYFYRNINMKDFPKDVFVVKVKGAKINYSTKLIKL
jgi:hypothetical protein